MLKDGTPAEHASLSLGAEPEMGAYVWLGDGSGYPELSLAVTEGRGPMLLLDVAQGQSAFVFGAHRDGLDACGGDPTGCATLRGARWVPKALAPQALDQIDEVAETDDVLEAKAPPR